MKNYNIKSISSITAVFVLCIVTLWSCKEDDGDILVTNPNKLIITGIVPEEGTAGDTVTISGINFSANASENLVLFADNIPAEIVSASPERIVAIVPQCALAGNVSVTKNNEEAPGPFFDLSSQPVISNVSPANGVPLSVITITGTDFSSEISDNTVFVGGFPAQVLSASCNSLTVQLSEQVFQGPQPIEVTVLGNSTVFTNFTVDPYTSQFIQITSPSDDAEEGSNGGTMWLTSTDLDFGKYDLFDPTGVDQGIQKFGLRFNNVQIPQGASVILSAIQFTAQFVGSDADGWNRDTQLTIYGHNVDNSATFTLTDSDVSNRPKTSANVVWDIPLWLNAGDRGLAQRTIDLSSIVQEIVNRPGWVPGNSISFILEHSGPSLALDPAVDTNGGRSASTFFDGQAELKTIHLD